VQQPNFPSVIVNPGQIYEQQLIWEFGVQGGNNATTGNETAANGTGLAAANASSAVNSTQVPAAGAANATAGNVPAVPAGDASTGPIVGSATEIGLDNATAPVVNVSLPGDAAPAVIVAPDVAGGNVVVAENATGNAAGGGTAP
jgi:hypothetical protein